MKSNLPKGYRWATADETDREDAISVLLTEDSNGHRYTNGEADLAVPLLTSNDIAKVMFYGDKVKSVKTGKIYEVIGYENYPNGDATVAVAGVDGSPAYWATEHTKFVKV